MSFDLQVIRTEDFLRFGGNEKGLEPRESRAALERIARACIERGIDSALIDVRDMESDLTPADLYRLVSAFRQMGFKEQHRLAVLHRTRAGEKVKFFSMSPPERAEFFAQAAADAGWNVRAFDNYEDAVAWFNEHLPAS
jgi:hypothetical protein